MVQPASLAGGRAGAAAGGGGGVAAAEARRGSYLELLVCNVKLVLGILLSRVRDTLHTRAGKTGNDLGDVSDAGSLCDLIENFDALARLRWVGHGELNAAAGIRNMNEGTRLTAGAVDSEGDAGGRLPGRRGLGWGGVV